MDQSDAIGNKIARIRELRNMKQQTLAELIGVSQQQISSIEKSNNISTKCLQDIAVALGVTPKVIYNFDVNGVISLGDQPRELDFLRENNNEFELVEDIMSIISNYRRKYETMIRERDQRITELETTIKKMKEEKSVSLSTVR